MIQVRANPIGAADFHGFANRICEGPEQIRINISYTGRKVYVKSAFGG